MLSSFSRSPLPLNENTKIPMKAPIEASTTKAVIGSESTIAERMIVNIVFVLRIIVLFPTESKDSPFSTKQNLKIVMTRHPTRIMNGLRGS
mmetsp:Transcript_21790/g.25066  ORF Transcript_21790/g.25066 Transcript_21790/m.25066 type:complete len:91 (+) Transcript_21790:232-504(+)